MIAEKRMNMKTSDFDYNLPQELIAQTPVEPRDSSRLLVYHRDTGAVEHKIFRDVIDYLNPGDVLVINQTRVIPARLYGVKEGTGGAIEFLLLRRLNLTDWEVILKPGKKARRRAASVSTCRNSRSSARRRARVRSPRRCATDSASFSACRCTRPKS